MIFYNNWICLFLHKWNIKVIEISRPLSLIPSTILQHHPQEPQALKHSLSGTWASRPFSWYHLLLAPHLHIAVFVLHLYLLFAPWTSGCYHGPSFVFFLWMSVHHILYILCLGFLHCTFTDCNLKSDAYVSVIIFVCVLAKLALLSLPKILLSHFCLWSGECELIHFTTFTSPCKMPICYFFK